MTINEVLLGLATQPYKVLVVRWNWKSALLSSSFRALIFFSVNISEGWSAASGAMLAEFLYRAATAGFGGSVIQAFRKALKAGRRFLRRGLTVYPERVIRLTGRIRSLKTGERSSFRLWYEQGAEPVFPIRFEFRARTFLRLAFEQDRRLFDGPSGRFSNKET